MWPKVDEGTRIRVAKGNTNVVAQAIKRVNNTLRIGPKTDGGQKHDP